MEVLLLDLFAQAGKDSAGPFEYMLEKFLPGAIMAVISIAVIAWVIRLVVFFIRRFQERNTKENPHENKETMGLPKGAMRTFLALAFTSLAVIAIFGDSSNIFVHEDDKKWILVELGAIITFYFGSKTLESYVDSKAKLKAIDKAESAEDASRIYRDLPVPAKKKEGDSSDQEQA